MTHPGEPSFEGTIATTVADSTPWWPEANRPAAGRPNVVVIVLDDIGFAHFGCYGSEIDTPNIDRLAADGLRYTELPRRRRCARRPAPALLTGRNHHSVGMRMRGRLGHRLPATCAATSPRAPPRMAEVLRDDGLRDVRASASGTSAPMDEHVRGRARTTTGRCQRGFDRFYGFLDGETDQFHPELVADNHIVDPPRTVGRRLPPQRGPGRPRRSSFDPRPRSRSAPTGRSSSTSRSAPRHCAAPGARRVPREVPRAASTRAGTSTRDELVRASSRQLGRRARGHRARAAQPRRRGVGRPAPRTSAGSRPACRRRSPASSTTPTRRSAGSSTTSTRSASSTTR